MFDWLRPARRPLVIAHRGSSAFAPENTLAAFRRAVSDGADAVELDVHLSREGEVVVIHDPRLQRTTDGRGWVSRHSVDELKRLDAGGWFHRSFAGERVPTLSEVLEELGGRVGVNIEIKGNRRQQKKGIVERCLTVVRRHRASRSIMISSFHHPFVKRVKLLDRSILAGVLYHPVHNMGKPPHLLAANAGGAEFFICGDRSLRRALLGDIRSHGLRLSVYSIDTVRQFERISHFPVDCIVTDNPPKILRLLGRAVDI